MRKLRSCIAVLSVTALAALSAAPTYAATSSKGDPTGDVGTSVDVTNLSLTNSLNEISATLTMAQPVPSSADSSWVANGGTRELIVPLNLNDNAVNTIIPAIYTNGSFVRVLPFDVIKGELGADGYSCPAGSLSIVGSELTMKIDATCLNSPAKVASFAVYGHSSEVDIIVVDDRNEELEVEDVTVQEPGGQILLGEDGGIFNIGDSQFYGSTGDKVLNAPVVSMAKNPTGEGYWFVAADGGIFTYGPGTQFYGSQGANRLNQPIVGMAPTPSGKGYWLVASDGGVFSHGDAQFYGSTGDITLNQPIVGMVAAPSGDGYYLVASDGGVFAFGGAKFQGSTGNFRINQPIVSMATSGRGYYLLARDGGIFAFGGATFYGSGGADFPKAGLEATALIPEDDGYRIVTTDGSVVPYGPIFDYGDLPTRGIDLNAPIVGGVSG